ncbi:MAG: efflux RND transporter periplasmic adaptor subunit [Candidatus Cryptobacteroides sp.]
MSLLITACKNSVSDNPQLQAEAYPTMTISLSDKTLSRNYSASIRGKQDVEIRAQISALITGIHVQEGQTVKTGQPLFTLDQVSYKAAVETAKANLALAEAEVETASQTFEAKKALYAKSVISEYDLNLSAINLKSAQASLLQAEAQLRSAKNDYSYTVIKSPSDGVVGTLPFRVGSLVGPSTATALTTVSDNTQMYVYFSLSENQLLQLTQSSGSLEAAIKAMPELSLSLSTGDIYQYKGKVESISGVIDKKTGAVSVRSIFPNGEKILLSGGSGSVIFPFELKDVIVIPQGATYELQDKKFVYKVVDGIAQSQEIGVYPVNDGSTYVVTSGLSVGDVIISEGAGLVKNGTKVKCL